jgi:hypothetical protein
MHSVQIIQLESEIPFVYMHIELLSPFACATNGHGFCKEGDAINNTDRLS